MKHILFITSTNLASNPRCRKEVELAIENGYQVSVIAFQMSNWTWEKELQIRESLPAVTFYYIPAGRSSYRLWLESVFFEKACVWLNRIGIKTTQTLGIGVNRRAVLIQKLLKSKNLQPDIAIAHNPGAFWPAIYLANKKIPIGIDVEDYHPGEVGDQVLSDMHKLLLQKALPAATYVSFASGPIMDETVSLLKSSNGVTHFVINNLFKKRDFPSPAEQVNDGPLRIVWFSQNIDAGRGLEQILPILDRFTDRISVTLIGNAGTAFCEQFVAPRKHIKLVNSMSQAELNSCMSNYDIGLAIEPGKDRNNTLALSNKICTYFQAGMYIIATETIAQASFIESFPEHGTLIDLKMENLEPTLVRLLAGVVPLRNARLSRWEAAQGQSWEHENQKLRLAWSKMA
ncbi:hypothetical protein [Paraflavitalea sp. CAU 1676]|uniref:hypothetical protein n=1 Tax=Paraflavitalea sp. CAU 1676 TaxID=3032598 RepID=UPI0023DBFA5C|nr:hypothetical protein [Paraflavitalea sp. CAU 1676]MDF2187069.1 hypothetical protein [Paraflavitalea sp. CAU 1676]